MPTQILEAIIVVIDAGYWTAYRKSLAQLC